MSPRINMSKRTWELMSESNKKQESESTRRPSTMISVRLSPEEARVLREAAAANGESVSEYVRRVALSPQTESAVRGTVLFDPQRPAIVSAQQLSHSFSGTQTIGDSWRANSSGSR
ncbi:MAG: plasmid mobilization protein [Leifsonia sp.]